MNQFCDGCDGCVTDIFAICVTSLAFMCRGFSRFVTDVTDIPSRMCARAHARACMSRNYVSHPSHFSVNVDVERVCSVTDISILSVTHPSHPSHSDFSQIGLKKMADIADLANDRIAQEIDMTLRTINVTTQASDDCVECGERISEARQQATGGTQYCIECANIIEQKRGLYR